MAGLLDERVPDAGPPPLEEIFRLCDAVTVLRDGRHVTTAPIGALDRDRLVELMIGRKLDEYFPSHVEHPPRDVVHRALPAAVVVA